MRATSPNFMLTKIIRYTVPPSLHDNWCYVCVSNCVSGTALAIYRLDTEAKGSTGFRILKTLI